MSEQTDIDDGWDALVEDGSAEPAPRPARPAAPGLAPPPAVDSTPAPGKPAAPKIAPPTARGSKPAVPTIAPPPAVGSRVAPPPAVGSKPAATAGSKPLAPPPASASSAGTAVPGKAARAPVPLAASLRAGAPRLAPPPTVAPRPVAALGLPPPPEFLPRGHSAELPLENEVRDDSALLDVSELLAPTDASGGIEIEAPAELGPGDSMELDLEVSDDAVPRVSDPAAVPRGSRAPYPAQLPRTPSRPSAVATIPAPVVPPKATVPASVVPPKATVPAPTVEPAPKPASAPARRARAATFTEILPSAPSRSLGPWFAAGAVVALSILALVWLTSGDEDEPAEGRPAVTAAPAPEVPTAPPSPETPRSPAEPQTPPPAPADASPEPAEPDDAPAEPDDAPTEPDDAPAEPDPTPAARPPHDPDAAIIRVAPDTSAYDRAAADYEATGSHEALLAMTKAACVLRDGPKARAAFRKLLGRTLRSEAIVACREHQVDVSSTVSGYTGPELLAQARAAMEAGDAQTAFEKAFASNKVERSSEAVLVQGLAACALGNGDKAQRLLPHVSKKSRPALVEGCQAKGIELRP